MIELQLSEPELTLRSDKNANSCKSRSEKTVSWNGLTTIRYRTVVSVQFLINPLYT